MSAYDDYSHALGGDNLNDRYEPKDTRTRAEENNSDVVDLRIPASTAELDEREAALIAMENNLLEKSKQIKDRDAQLAGSGVVEDNWPCAFYPITYHSIKSEIPPQHQAFVRKHYWILKLTMFALTWNFFTMVIMYIENAASSMTLTWATMYVLIGVPGAWKMWYKAIYRAVGTDKRVKFVQYFLFGGCHTIFCVVACIGIPETAMMGVMFMIKAMNKGTAVGICGLISCAAWLAIALGSVLMVKRTFRLYKSRGGDLQKDSAAFRSDVADNVATGRMVLQGVNAAR